MISAQEFFKPGAVVYFKECRRGSTKKADAMRTKGYGFGVLLGVVPPFQKEPDGPTVLRLLASVGFVAVDEIIELLGKEAGDEFIRKFEQKYYGQTSAEQAVQEAPPPEPPKPQLVGVDGRPLTGGKVLELPR